MISVLVWFMKKKDRLLDQFYSSSKAVKQTLDILNKKIDIKNSIFVEPSAGTGNFIDGVKEIFPKNEWLAFDLEPKKDYIKQQIL